MLPPREEAQAVLEVYIGTHTVTLASYLTPNEMFSGLLTLAALVVAVSAQAPTWGQCGGIGWSGPTTCVSGSACVKQNDYYSQCIPGASTPTTASTVVPTSPPSSTTSNPAPTSSAPSTGTNYWFSFGDSYTSTSFDINGAKPAPGNPLGNPAYPGGTTTGGENWIDYNTARLNKSLTLTYNFAVSGAVIDNNIVSPIFPGLKSMTDQVNQFLSALGNKPASAPWTSDNALFSVWIGINDIGSTYSQGGDRGAFSDRLLTAEFAALQKLVGYLTILNIPLLTLGVQYDVGARNFLFINVPPVNRSPMMISNSGASTEATVITGHNSRMATKISSWAASNSGVKTFSYDSWSAFTKILDSPSSYGFRDATSVGNAATNFWGDVYHPTSYAHKYFAQDIAALLADTVW
ncbi:hypothetical protein VNI00_013321 [Paramarasmius palmivorus]|uniref:CBM1 domain-containing protein n=1 Tax=Paramarasmius palmivorus TaxID=297713 RepID=A0AAW0BYC7_9AGAR